MYLISLGKFERMKMTHATKMGLLGLLAFLCISCGGEEKDPQDTPPTQETTTETKPWFDISLAQWSVHKALYDGKMTNMDFPQVAKDSFGITAVEYVSRFFEGNETNTEYLTELKKKTDALGVRNVLIMVDGEGELGATDPTDRQKAVENHYKWVDAAAFLGCHSIRVNAGGDGPARAVQAAVVNSLSRLGAYAATKNINVIVENHGGNSSNGQWLADIMTQVNRDNVGTLPDFGNFCLDGSPKDCPTPYDRYQGMEELLPFAKGVSAKSYNFDPEGNETKIDFARMMQLVKAAGYAGYVGVEYEGDTLGEFAGVRATKALLERYQ